MIDDKSTPIGLLRAMENSEPSREALQHLMNALRRTLRDGDLIEVERALVLARVEGLSTTVLLVVLTATLVYCEQLCNRPAFYRKTEELLRARGQLVPGMLDGLESFPREGSVFRRNTVEETA